MLSVQTLYRSAAHHMNNIAGADHYPYLRKTPIKSLKFWSTLMIANLDTRTNARPSCDNGNLKSILRKRILPCVFLDLSQAMNGCKISKFLLGNNYPILGSYLYSILFLMS